MPQGTRDQIHSYPFTPAEFERLYIFKQAFLAGFYTDQLRDEDEDAALADRGSQEGDRSGS